MYNTNDWEAAMSSEIFREYLGNELIKEAKAKPLLEPIFDNVAIMKDFEEFQNTVRSTPKLLLGFKALQNKFETDIDYRNKVDPKFAEAVLLLDLEVK